MYAPHAGTRTIARQRWEAEQRRLAREQEQRNAARLGAFLNSLKRVDVITTPECGE